MVRTRLVVSGNVQGVGYRTLVMQIARKFRIKGLTRNLKDGAVEIFCECDDETLERFKKAIDKKAVIDEPFIVDVERIETYLEGDENYINAPEEFEIFHIDYGRALDEFQKESLKRSEVGILLLGGTREDIRGMHEDMKGMRTDLSSRLTNVDNHLVGIDSKLGTVIERYDTFSVEMKELKNSMKKIEEQFTRLVDHFVNKVVK